MKTVTLQEMEIIADIHGGQFIEDEYTPSIIFFDEEGNKFGFEATETMDGQYYGFAFFGDPKKQAQANIMACWGDLTNPAIVGDLLTIERGKQLIGKKVIVSYNDVNQGTEFFKIVGMEERPTKSIGQSTCQILLTVPINEYGTELPVPGGAPHEDWVYEWQGIFRRGSGAERLFIEKILH